MTYSSSRVSLAVSLALSATAPVFAASTTFNSGSNALAISTEQAAILAAANSSATVGLPAITFSPGNNSYANGHKITLPIVGATVFSAAEIGTVACDPAAQNATGTMSLIFEGVSNNVVTLTVANRDANPVYTSGAQVDAASCKIPANTIKVLASSVASPTQVTIGYTAQTASGTVYDTLVESAVARNPVVIAASLRNVSLVACTSSDRNPITNANRASAIVSAPSSTTGLCTNGATPFDGVISGISFTGTGDAAHSDTLSWVIRNEEAASEAAITNNNVTIHPAQDAGLLNAGGSVTLASNGKLLIHTITGDFNFLDDDANGCTLADLTAGAGQLGVVSTTRADPNTTPNMTATSISTDCRTLVLESAVDTSTNGRDMRYAVAAYVNGAAQNGVAVTGAGGSRVGRALATTPFSVRTELKANATSAALSTVEPAGGAWTAPVALTSSANIPYVPYGTGISRIIYVTNTSSTVPLTVALSARGETGTSCATTNFATVTIPASGVVNIGGAVDAGVRACFPTIDAVGGKVQVNIASTGTTASAGAFEVTSSYNASGNRVNIINSTN